MGVGFHMEMLGAWIPKSHQKLIVGSQSSSCEPVYNCGKLCTHYLETPVQAENVGPVVLAGRSI